MPEDTQPDEKQCRICLDGPEAEFELGRLIRPCLCKGSISYVHVKCLQRWRNESASSDAFYSCPQCHYHYYFARTSALGIATNPIVIGALSTAFFTIIVLLSSFLTTFFTAPVEEPSYYFSFYLTTFDIVKALVRATVRILQDSEDVVTSSFFETHTTDSPIAQTPPGIFMRLIRRFVLGLPVVGAASLVHMLLSVPFFGPVHWLARYRGNRDRRGNSRDIAAILIIVLIVVGIVQAVYKVYKLTERMTKWLLLRAEDTILEVQ